METKDNSHHITLSQAAKLTPGRPSVCAVWRWARRGIKSRTGDRIRLEHVRVGGRIYTTPDSLTAFFKAVSAADAAHFNEAHVPTTSPRRKRTEKQRERDIETAERELRAAGI